jgi:hypothetical protein
MRTLMTAAVAAAALTLVSGVAMAQSYYGPGDPAWADTSDPGSIQTPRAYYGSARLYGSYYGYDTYSYSRPYQGDWRSSGYQPRHGGYDWWW